MTRTSAIAGASTPTSSSTARDEGAPGKRPRTARLRRQALAAPPPVAASTARPAAAQDPLDDPFALHLVERAADEAGRGGVGLPGPIRRSFEASLGRDLGGVRIHDGGASSAAAHRLGASAYTTGADIHFAAGRYRPETSEGQRLLAHEVAHTAQAWDPAGGVSEPGDASEVEADDAAERMIRGAPARVAGGAAALRRHGPEVPTGGAPMVATAATSLLPPERCRELALFDLGLITQAQAAGIEKFKQDMVTPDEPSLVESAVVAAVTAAVTAATGGLLARVPGVAGSAFTRLVGRSATSALDSLGGPVELMQPRREALLHPAGLSVGHVTSAVDAIAKKIKSSVEGSVAGAAARAIVAAPPDRKAIERFAWIAQQAVLELAADSGRAMVEGWSELESLGDNYPAAANAFLDSLRSVALPAARGQQYIETLGQWLSLQRARQGEADFLHGTHYRLDFNLEFAAPGGPWRWREPPTLRGATQAALASLRQFAPGRKVRDLPFYKQVNGCPFLAGESARPVADYRHYRSTWSFLLDRAVALGLVDDKALPKSTRTAAGDAERPAGDPAIEDHAASRALASLLDEVDALDLSRVAPLLVPGAPTA